MILHLALESKIFEIFVNKIYTRLPIVRHFVKRTPNPPCCHAMPPCHMAMVANCAHSTSAAPRPRAALAAQLASAIAIRYYTIDPLPAILVVFKTG